VGTDLFSTLRVWHNKRAGDLDERGWNRLSLAVFHATPPYSWIRDHQSTFNVGLRVELDDFDVSQVHQLNERHGLPLLGDAEINRLMEVVGGHPDLVNLALSAVSSGSHSLDEVVNGAPDESGPFTPHLRVLEDNFQRDATLAQAFQKVLRAGRCDDERLFDGLLALGLVRGLTEDRVEPRYKLYKDYFGKNWPKSSR
jgi:serine/threonine-protein kinase